MLAILQNSDGTGVVTLEHIHKVDSQIHPSLTLEQIRELAEESTHYLTRNCNHNARER